MRAVHLRCDNRMNPLGIGNVTPYFSWNCEGGITQNGYQIICTRGEEIIWDTGKRASSEMINVKYQGKTLRGRDYVVYKVQLWDEQDHPGEVEEAHFEIGLVHQTDWQAKWISGNRKVEKNTRYPLDLFRRKLSLEQPLEKVQCARIYASACGVYRLFLNGNRVGNFELAPGCTDYRKRVAVQTYDITSLLQTTNTLDISLADGWWAGSLGAHGQLAVYGHQTAVAAQLEITYEDGSMQQIITDDNFLWCDDGPVRSTDLQDGEVIDCRRTPGYQGRAIISKGPLGQLVMQENVPITCHERFAGVVSQTPSGKTLVDFGQNVAGFVGFTAKGTPGTKIKVRLGETIGDDGELTQKNFQVMKLKKEWSHALDLFVSMGMAEKLRGEKQATPLQQVELYCSGEEDVYEMAYAFSGFRYGEVTIEGDAQVYNYEAVAVYSDMEPTGEFCCSEDKVNRLVENIRWSMKGNYIDIPMDCPTRERMGWTGDAEIFFNAGSYLFDTSVFMRKWMRDIEDATLKNGLAPAVIPYAGMAGMYNNTASSVGFADVMELLPYRYYQRYQNKDLLREFYPYIRGYANYLMTHTGHKNRKDAKKNPYNDYVYEKGVQLGEWLEAGEFKEDGRDANKPHPEEATAYLHYSMKIMAEIADILGEDSDKNQYLKYAAGAKEAYRHMFLEAGAPDTDRQAKLVRPLALGLADGDDLLVKALQDRLAQAVENRKYRIATGFLSTVHVLPQLVRAGRTDLAYKMLENEEAPGWLYEVTHGATTIWEEWEGGAKGQFSSGSMNHYSPGSVAEWIFSGCLGIQVEGENHFTLMPVPGGKMEYASGSYLSPFGKVESKWEKCDGGIAFTFTIPPNTTAEVTLPDGTNTHIGPGKTSLMMP